MKMGDKYLDETSVQHAIIKWLSKNNWQILDIPILHSKGVDIKAKHNRYGRYFSIETKGGKFSEVNFVYSLGQIITRMRDSGTTRNYYALGLPEQSAKIAIRRVPYQVAVKLCLHVFSVDINGNVKLYSPKDLKKIQKKNLK